jgi:crotonobetaine/carnitine-CoA ligase
MTTPGEFERRVRSPHTTVAAGRTLPWLLDLRAEQRGEHPFVIWEPFDGPGRTWGYREFAERSRQLAAGLQARGVRAGDRLILHADNSPEFLLTWFACARVGAVAVCTNTRSVGDELRYFADHSEAIGAVTQPQYFSLVADAMPEVKWIAVTETDSGDVPQIGTSPGRGDSYSALFGDSSELKPVDLGPYAPATIQYTSGTTARPKAVVWTHANCLWAGQVSAAHETLLPNDVHLVYLPMYHTNAQSYSVLASLWVGATIVLEPRFSASRFWDVSLRHRCTWTSISGFCVRALEKRDSPTRHSYRLWGSGVSSPRQDALFGVRTIGWWGMTETVSHGIVDDVLTPGRSLSCGRPAPEYEIAVLRPDGTPVEPGETGALFVRGIPGVSLFSGYLHDQRATEAALDQFGWLRTDDLVTINADGSIMFADRDKDVLKVGGENVGASEIERVIAAVPGVSEVAVVAGPDDMLTEVPIAFVVPSESRPDLADDVQAACRAKLADFKVPRQVHVVEDLPRSTLNKVAKAQLRAQLSAAAGPR